MPAPALLAPYNLRFNARILRDHLTPLRARGHVWWGRFYNGSRRFDAAAARERWPHVAKVADERAASSEPTLVFVTDYHDLHVLKVTRILLGDDPGEGAREEAPAYYADRSVPLWFRVEDARALSYDRATTNDWYAERLGGILGGSTRHDGRPFTFNFDPAASGKHEFPIVVEGPECDALFGRASLPKGLARWCDAHDAMSPRPVQKAMDHLEKFLDARVWPRLSSAHRDNLAHAWIARTQLERDEDVNPATAFAHVARAVERALRDELMTPLERLAGARGDRGFSDALAEARGSGPKGPLAWSLGSIAGFLESLPKRHRRSLDTLRLDALLELGKDVTWIRAVQPLRNLIAHGSGEERAASKKMLFGFFEERGRAVVPILDARDGVAEALR